MEIEDCEEDNDDLDSDYHTRSYYIQDFPGAAGLPLQPCKLEFEEYRQEQMKAGLQPWSPFQSEDEWELARWLMESGTSHGKIDQFLKLNKVCILISLEKKLCD
ncbi:hypothetical protein EV360DRAFT_47473 [Lentinula raphanica]|nr:hypothetical protein EV360DRAFT_47473 [Lentinula raphanica]